MDFESFVLAASLSELSAEPRARAHADAVEFRMDLADGPIEALESYDGSLPVIATSRIEVEGGEATPGERRREALRSAATVPAVEAVDLELAVAKESEGRELLGDLLDAGVDPIVSVHDHERTPPRRRMREQLEWALDLGTVGKLAVTAADHEDVLDLLAVTNAVADQGPVATMAMGGPGRHSRAVAPLYGSRVGYAPVDPAAATAPGQYDLATLAELIAALR